MSQNPDGSAVPEYSPDLTVTADPRPDGPPPPHPVHTAPHPPLPHRPAPARRGRLVLWIATAAAVLVAASLAIVLPIAFDYGGGGDADPTAHRATATPPPSPAPSGTADLRVRDLFRNAGTLILSGGTEPVWFNKTDTRDEDDCEDELIPFPLTGCEHLLSGTYENRDGRYRAVVTVLDFADAGEAGAAGSAAAAEGVVRLPDGEHWISSTVIGQFVVACVVRVPESAPEDASPLAGGFRYKVELNLRQAAGL